jgi:hypothetical protein
MVQSRKTGRKKMPESKTIAKQLHQFSASYGRKVLLKPWAFSGPPQGEVAILKNALPALPQS